MVFPGLSWFWYFWRLEVSYFVEYFLTFWDCMLPHDYIQMMHLWPKYHRNNDVFSLHSLRWHSIFICVIIDDAHFDHLSKVVSVRLLPDSPLLLVSILWSCTLKPHEYIIPHHTFYPPYPIRLLTHSPGTYSPLLDSELYSSHSPIVKVLL